MTTFTEIKPDTFLARSDDMPRTKTAEPTTTVPADLEQQVVTDADLDAMDVPRFDYVIEPSREEKIAELNARDDALNARCGVQSPMGFLCTLAKHGDDPHSWQTLSAAQMYPDATPAAGVRPSERCGFRSNLGVSCTEHEGHASPHSWQASGADFAASNQVEKPEDSLDQAELPGMPEEPVTEWTVPTEAVFRGAKLMESEGLAAIGARLIEDDDSLEHLTDTEIRYFWRRRGGTQGGLPRYGRIKKPSAYEALAFGSRIIFLVDLSSDHAREAKFTEQQIEAQIHEQLCRTSVDPDDHDAYRIDALDFSGSIRTFDKFGAYKPEVREAHAHMALVPVEQEPEAEEASDDEGEADE